MGDPLRSVALVVLVRVQAYALCKHAYTLWLHRVDCVGKSKAYLGKQSTSWRVQAFLFAVAWAMGILLRVLTCSRRLVVELLVVL